MRGILNPAQFTTFLSICVPDQSQAHMRTHVCSRMCAATHRSWNPRPVCPISSVTGGGIPLLVDLMSSRGWARVQPCMTTTLSSRPSPAPRNWARFISSWGSKLPLLCNRCTSSRFGTPRCWMFIYHPNNELWYAR